MSLQEKPTDSLRSRPSPPAGPLAAGLSRRAGSALAAVDQLAGLGLPIRMGFRELSFTIDDLVRHDTTVLVLPGSAASRVDLLACFEYLGHPARKSPRWLQFSWGESGEERDSVPSPPGNLDPITTDPAVAGRYYVELIGETPPAGAVSLRLHSQDRYLGELFLHREAAFGAEDLDLLRRAYRHILRFATNTLAAEALERLHVSETGVAYCSAERGVTTRTAKAVRLMHWARRSSDGTPDFLTEQQPLWGSDWPSRVRADEGPDREIKTNAFGRFIIDRFPLHDIGEGPMESVQVQRLTPAELQIFCSRTFRQLSPRQRDVVLGLMRGRSHAEIATDLASAASTVVTHVRSIYEKTGAASREDLLKALLKEAAPWERIPPPPTAAGAAS